MHLVFMYGPPGVGKLTVGGEPRRFRLFAVLVSLCCALAPLVLFPNATAIADTVPVQVCSEDRAWQRPTPEEMARTVWRDNRYVDRLGPNVEVWPVLVPYATEHFLLFTGFSSGMSHAEDLTGLMATHPSMCAPSDSNALRLGATVEIWSIGYHVDGADVTDDTLTLSVEPNATTSTGYAIILVPRPQQRLELWTARFVLADGTEIAAASPVHELVASAVDDQRPDAGLPAGLPRPEDGHSMLDSAASVVRDSAGRITYARYIVLVHDGTTTSTEANSYQAALQHAGFNTAAQATTSDGSATLVISGSTNADPVSGTVLVQDIGEPAIPGVLDVALSITYPDGP